MPATAKMMIMPRMMSMMAVGTPMTLCIIVPPVERMPNRMATTIEASGFSCAMSAMATPSKPKPEPKPSARRKGARPSSSTEPPRPAAAPEITNDRSTRLRTGKPFTRAATWFMPVARILKPNDVRNSTYQMATPSTMAMTTPRWMPATSGRRAPVGMAMVLGRPLSE